MTAGFYSPLSTITGLTSADDTGRSGDGSPVPGFGFAVAGFVWVLVVCLWFAATQEPAVGLLVPVTIAALPVVARGRQSALVARWISVVLLAVVNVIGSASIGWFLVPATGAMLYAAAVATEGRK